tara:strand:+ start:3876 stop:6740 length:2865 start_codon:yes stop_codon:yes gene_type:complete
MINLEPIAKSVQKRLFEKMRALGRETSYSDSPTDGLTQQEMLSRTTFIRMSSNQENPVILMGGEILPNTPTTDSEGNVTIINNGKLAGGYDDLYSSRGYMDNPNKRPLPGIKSIDVSFKGGARAQREATISWTCWSFEDIDRLTPHFLAHGKTVLLDWGWIYNKNSLSKLQNLMGNGGLTKSAFEDYSEEIKKGGGDFDSIVGIIKNFEYTTRADGAFDCQTIIGSLGVSIIDNTIPTQEIIDSGVKVNVSSKESRQKLRDKFKKISNDDESVLTFDLNITLNTFISKIDSYLQENITTKNISPIKVKNSIRHISTLPNKYIVETAGISGNTEAKDVASHNLLNAWVRWGWFEDNVLSKFTSMTSDKNILTRFRSIDDKSSVKIRSSKYLETIDFSSYILPGKTFAIAKDTKINIAGENITLTGDEQNIITLSSLVNENFPHFSPSQQKTTKFTGTKEQNLKLYSIDPEMRGKSKSIREARYNQLVADGKIKSEKKVDNGEFGYLRNMLINTKIIKKAFSDTLSLVEAMDNLFVSINTPINFWSFQLESDPDLPNQIRITDDQHTAVNFNKPLKPQRSTYVNEEILNNGIFFFPVWRHDSIVKSQNISAKVPTAMQLATMYGSNLDQFKYPNGAGITGEKNGLIVGGLNNENSDRDNKGVDFAFKNNLEIGNANGFAGEDLEKNGSDDGIVKYIVDNIEEIKKSVNDLTEEKDVETKEASEFKKITWERIDYDSSKPVPPLNFLTPSERAGAFKDVDKSQRENLATLIGSKYEASGDNDSDYKIKKDFKDSIGYLSTEHIEGGSGDTEQSILVPLEMELEIDGTGGIYPGNSYHSTYLPQRYQDKTVFQIFDVNHTVSSTGWTTSLSGKMRTSYNQIFLVKDVDTVVADLIKNYQNKLKNDANEDKAKKQQDKLDEAIRKRNRDIKLKKESQIQAGGQDSFNPPVPTVGGGPSS